MKRDELTEEQALALQNVRFDSRDEEIDLKELFIALWQGKYIIIASTVLIAVMAVVYALNAKQTWTTEATVTEPQVSDFANYQKMVNDFQPVFDVYQEDGTILVSEKLDDFLAPENLFQIFVQQYQSRANKKAYISTNPAFQTELEALPVNEDEKLLQKSIATLYSNWYKKLSANEIKTNGEVAIFTLSGEQESAEVSFDFMLGYLNFIDSKAKHVAVANLSSAVQAQRNQLIQQKALLTDQAISRLQNEKILAGYALEIAKAAEISQPQPNLGDKELFAINIGANALEAKVKVLDNLSNLGLIEPRLRTVEAKINLLSNLAINPDVDFKTYRFIEAPEEPLSRTSPKRPLIAILGVLLGGMLGCAIVLIRFAFREK